MDMRLGSIETRSGNEQTTWKALFIMSLLELLFTVSKKKENKAYE